LNSLSQVFGANPFGAIQIRHGTRHLQDSIMSAGTQAHAPDGYFQRALARFVERAERPQRRMGDLRVVESALLLNLARGLHPRAHFVAGRAVVLTAEFFVRNRRNFDVQIDAVEKRSADLAEVPLNLSGRTAAFPRRVSIIAAFTPVQVSTE
jgi:hypothetical protein